MSSKDSGAKKFQVKVVYNPLDESTIETKEMLTGELYKLITYINRTNKIFSITITKSVKHQPSAEPFYLREK